MAQTTMPTTTILASGVFSAIMMICLVQITARTTDLDEYGNDRYSVAAGIGLGLCSVYMSHVYLSAILLSIPITSSYIFPRTVRGSVLVFTKENALQCWRES